MATKQEELQNLRAMQVALQNIKALQKKEDAEVELIEEQYGRSIEEYPKYKPENFELKIPGDEYTIPSYLSSILVCVLSLIHGIIRFIELTPSVTGTEWNPSTEILVLFGIFFFSPILISLVPYVGGLVSAGVQGLLG